MEKAMKRRRSIIMAVSIVLAYIALMFFGAIFVYLFEQARNEAVSSISDAFAVFESLFNLRQGVPINVVTMGGRITIFTVMLGTVILAISFAAQIFSIIGFTFINNAMNHEDRREAEDKSDIIAEIKENQSLEAKIIDQQDELLDKEENIISKLDALRKK